MKKIFHSLPVVIFSGLLVGLLIIWWFNWEARHSLIPAEASVNTSYSYATSTGQNNNFIKGGTTGTSNIRTLRAGSGEFGSVVFTAADSAANSGKLIFYDATTSNATFRVLATSSLSVLAAFSGTSTPGTYTFDTVFHNGILVVGEGTQLATTTITWK